MVLDPFEHGDELDLEPEQSLFVVLVGDLPRPVRHLGDALAGSGLRLFVRRFRLARRFLRRLRLR